MSFMKKDKEGTLFFQIYWNEVIQSMKSNPHYKKLKKKYLSENESLDIEQIEVNNQEEDLNEYMQLQLDMLHKVYQPYMKSDFRWSNSEKKFVFQKMLDKKKEFYPNEIKMLLNEYRQRITTGAF